MFEQIFVVEPKKDLDKNIFYLDTYYPYRRNGEKSPNFDGFSKLILNLKEKKQDAIDCFFQKLHPLLGKGFPIITVPSSDPKNIDTGISQLASLLAQQGRIDATSCLQRHTKVEKKSSGGNRHVDIDLSSIKVNTQHIVKGKTVLLLDDVTTTGNSFRSCETLLNNAGVIRVVKLALGKTES